MRVSAWSCVLIWNALWLATLVGSRSLAQEKVRPPNILFMYTDDQAQNCMGCSGNSHIQTPNMDRLARGGRLFENAFVTTAICCTSRASILTGQHMRRHGITDFNKPLSAEAFDLTYPRLLQNAGYRTGYLGKFAIGNPDQFPDLSLPKEKFDFWYGFPQQHLFLQKVDGKDVHLTAEITRRAIDFLQTNPKDQPFCLTIAFKEPHGPWDYFDPAVSDPYADAEIPFPATFTREAFEAEPEFIRHSLNADASEESLSDPEQLEKYLRTVYRLISRVDIAVGDILAELERSGLDENTVVIYSSDHGSMLGARGLKGKWLMYEESIRVPFIIYDPRLSKELCGQPTEAMALNIDIAPTILDLAGVGIPSTMQGQSLLPIVRGDESHCRQDWYYEHTYNTSPPRSPIAETEGVRTTRWKYIRYPGANPPTEQLFDLENDPFEQINLAADGQHAATLAELRARCDSYRQSLK